jgi:Holliday junction resolvase
LNKRYVSGRNFEYKVKEHYEKEGYYVVRTAGSKGIADLVAIPPLRPPSSLITPELPLLIQCKKMNYKKVDKHEIGKLLDYASRYRFTPVLVAKKGREMIFFEGNETLNDFLLGGKRK